MFGELSDRVSQGRALLLAGHCRAAAGDNEVAKRLFAEAERVFTACGAVASPTRRRGLAGVLVAGRWYPTKSPRCWRR
jgi:hypothetical protein